MGKNGKDLPLIRPKKDDCPSGGDHEDLPFVQELSLNDSDDKMVVFYCLKCRLLHWSVFPKKVELVEAVGEPTMHDDNPLLDGLPHA